MIKSTKTKKFSVPEPKIKNARKKIGDLKKTRGRKLPDTKNVIEIVYRYRNSKEFYLGGEDVQTYMSNLGSASVLGWTHGMAFKPLTWRLRKTKV